MGSLIGYTISMFHVWWVSQNENETVVNIIRTFTHEISKWQKKLFFGPDFTNSCTLSCFTLFLIRFRLNWFTQLIKWYLKTFYFDLYLKRKNRYRFYFVFFPLKYISTKWGVFKYNLIDCVAKVWQQTGWKWCDFIIYQYMSHLIWLIMIVRRHNFCIHTFYSSTLNTRLLILFNGTHSVILSRQIHARLCINYIYICL